MLYLSDLYLLRTPFWGKFLKTLTLVSSFEQTYLRWYKMVYRLLFHFHMWHIFNNKSNLLASLNIILLVTLLLTNLIIHLIALHILWHSINRLQSIPSISSPETRWSWGIKYFLLPAHEPLLINNGQTFTRTRTSGLE